MFAVHSVTIQGCPNGSAPCATTGRTRTPDRPSIAPPAVSTRSLINTAAPSAWRSDDAIPPSSTSPGLVCCRCSTSRSVTIVNGLVNISQTSGPSSSGLNVSSSIACGSIGSGVNSASGMRSASAAIAWPSSASSDEPITLCPLAPISCGAPVAPRSRSMIA